MDTVFTHPFTASDPMISVEALRAETGARRPLVLDVRREPAWAESGYRIAGALRCPPDAIDEAPGWLPPGARVVCACVHGHEVSRGAAARLRELGVSAVALEGGVEAWRAAGGPTRRADAVLQPPPRGGSTWVTRARPKVDRVACPWLVRRFVDPLARIVYLPADEVVAFASRTGAVAFDLPGSAIGHEGDRCSFDALLAAAGLEDRALLAVATIVRGADTDMPELAPQAAGLVALSRGLSLLHPADDHEMLDDAMTIYDALYAWAGEALRGIARGTAETGR
jgi:rhodanese-related sulfurtransferase